MTNFFKVKIATKLFELFSNRLQRHIGRSTEEYISVSPVFGRWNQSKSVVSCSSQRPSAMYKKYKADTKEENVVKSPNDPKDYRVVTLKNGLTALLISDTEATSDSPAAGDGEKEGEKLAAAALCVGVGSFSDPDDLPGLAHFLEHMVFMGSEKYPNENDFDEFVKKHGGMNNAYTECEHTVFYFNIEKTALQKGLDIFAGFFTKPLMKQGSVDREIKAVDSEFSMSRPRDGPRLEQLQASMAKKGHPMGKFTWGNLSSLKETPARQGIDLYARLQAFHKVAYSAEFMTLVVQAIYPLDTLEEWVTEIYSEVPTNGLPRPTFYDLKDPFDTKEYTKLYKMIPCQNKHKLVITWALPSQLKQYKSKPLHYLSFLAGHEGKGSIMAYLRKKMLASSLEAGNSEYGFEHNMTHAVFSVSVQLTDTGLEKYEEVIGVIMEYFKMLNAEGSKKWIYDEIKTIEDTNFRWLEESDPVDNVEAVAPNMLRYPVGDYFTGDKLYFEYDPELISDCAGRMQPDKASITVISKKFLAENICTEKEQWYKTPYCVNDIPKELIEKWKATAPRPELHLPEPNVFIASDFSLKPADSPTEFPIAVTETPLSRLWFKQDTKFKIPKANVNFMLISPAIKKSASSLCMLDLVLDILEHQMTETAYAASVANLGYSLKRFEHGLVISVCGFNHKLLKLFDTIVGFIAGISVDQELLDTMKNQLEKDYYNKSIKPTNLNKELRLAILRQNEQTLIDSQQALPGVTVDTLTAFVKEITSAVYVEGLVQGNLTVQEAKEFETCLLTKLNCKPIEGGKLPETVILDVPVGELVVRTDNLNTNDENTVINNYYQHGACDYHQMALHELLTMRMEEPCFDILRTREQLGYSVYCTTRYTDGILGMTITVCSQAHKFELDKLDEHIENFLKEFEGLMEKDTQEDFETLRSSLITLKQCADSNIGEEVQRNWSQISDRLYHFDTQKRMVEELKKISLDELRAWFKSQVAAGGKCKKLSIQVEGHKSAAKASEEPDDDAKDGANMEQDGDEDDDEDNEEEEMEDDEEDEEDEEEAVMDVDSYVFKDLLLKPVEGKPESSVITNIQDLHKKLPFYPPSVMK